MTTTINASNSGSGGLVQTADASGILALQTAGVTAVTLNASQALGVGSSPSYGTSGQVLTSAGSAASPAWTTPNVLTAGTAVASTSGTSIDFTGIPSTAKRITIMFNGVSTSGSSPPQVQIGSGSALTSGYVGYTWTGNTNNAAHSSGFLLEAAVAAAYNLYGHAVLTNISGNIWVFSTASGATTSNSGNVGGGSNTTLSGVLDRIRITTVNGTDTFDNGSINIFYE